MSVLIQPEFNWFGPRGKLERAFWEFHFKNPLVYELLLKFARQWKQFGGGVCGIHFLIERVRWEISIQTKGDGVFKINNNHAPFYARLIMVNEPDLVGIFRLRRQRIQTSFGPANDSLPPGDYFA